MGHKTHPLGFRLGITQQHRSAWYSKFNSYSKLIQEDFIIRKLIFDILEKTTMKSSGITNVFINRNNTKDHIDIIVETAKPGILVGEAGKTLAKIDQSLTHLLPTKKTLIDIIEIKQENIYDHADLIADILVSQLEDRIPFRRAMKGILEEAQKQNVKGIKIQIAGRLNGAEIARTEWLREGRVPLQTLRADIDYSYKTAHTIYGILGVKVWLFKGDILIKDLA